MDPMLSEIIASTDEIFSVEAHDKFYEELVRAIIAQQLSVSAASSIESKLRNLYAECMPSPEQIRDTPDDSLRGVGISSNKIKYLRDLADRIISGELDLHALQDMPDQQIVIHLTKVKGIGVWTAQMFLLFCLGRLDVLPSGDLGIQVGIQQIYNLPTRPNPALVEKLADDNRWHPYASVASWYIWKNKK